MHFHLKLIARKTKIQHKTKKSPRRCSLVSMDNMCQTVKEKRISIYMMVECVFQVLMLPVIQKTLYEDS